MKNLKPAAAIAAVIAAIGKALDCGTEAATRLLMLTGMDYGRAAARAPLVCGIVVCIIGLLCIAAWYIITGEVEHDRRDAIRPQRIERPATHKNWRGNDE